MSTYSLPACTAGPSRPPLCPSPFSLLHIMFLFFGNVRVYVSMGALASSTAVVAAAAPAAAALADPSAAAARARALTNGPQGIGPTVSRPKMGPRSALRDHAAPSFAAAIAAWTRLACSSWSVFTKRPMCTTSVISNGLAGGVVNVRAVGNLHSASDPSSRPVSVSGLAHVRSEPANVHFAEGEAQHGGPLGQLADHGRQLERVLQQRRATENVQAQSA